METVVFFLRHGETDANINNVIQGQSDVPLNDNGVKQAEVAGARLQKIHFDVIYSSDLSRAAVTAGYAANGRKIIYTDQLREWFFGDWQGKTFAEIEKIFPDEVRLYRELSSFFRPSGGESALELRDRAGRFLQKVAGECAGKMVLCVSHGAFIRAVFKYAMGIERLTARHRVDNTSLSCFRTTDGGESWQLVLWNDTSHLTYFTESEGV